MGDHPLRAHLLLRKIEFENIVLQNRGRYYTKATDKNDLKRGSSPASANGVRISIGIKVAPVRI